MEKQTIEQFGGQLLSTLDLDPVYVMLHNAWDQKLMSWAELCQWCVGYWCCYHAGVASWLTEIEPHLFWSGLMDVAQNGSRKWPRGTERRHFRGANAVNLVTNLEDRYATAEHFVLEVLAHSPRTFKEVARRVQSHVGFGPWIAFKIADMGERVLDFPVDFSDCMLGVYKEPVKGARMACEAWGATEKLTDLEALVFAVNQLRICFGQRAVPPDFKRPIGVQEFETILCKWKSHMNGHYPPGKDTVELRHSLQGYGAVAQILAELAPQAAN